MYALSQNPWNNPTDISRNELVFENRNKAYGAYALRQNYNFTLVKSLVFSAFIISGLFMVPKMNQFFKNTSIPLIYTDTTIINITPPPDMPSEDPEIPETKVNKTKVSVSYANLLKIIVDKAKVNENDTLTMEDINLLKTDILPNSFGTKGRTDLFDFKKGKDIIEIPDNTIHIFTTEMPEFKGGNDKIHPYLGSNIEYPSVALKEGIDAKVVVGFVVEKDGSISDIKILSCSEKGFGFEDEAIRVISGMPKWKPGKQNGHPARVFFNIPISFRLL